MRIRGGKPFLIFSLVLFNVVTVCFGQVPFTSSNLPIIVINTYGNSILDEPKIKAHMGIIDNGPGVRNNVSDAFNNYDGSIGIERRGSSSQMFPKPQYGVELWSKTGADSSASLLGLPEEEDWILFAPYNDKSLMRDVLAYKMSSMMGEYAPRTKFCELVLNNSYQGIYVLIEKIKRDDNRVDISKLEPHEISGEDVTGGYILKIDKLTGNGGQGFTSPHSPPYGNSHQIYFQYEYPEPEAINTAQRNYIESYVSKFENSLKSTDFHNTIIGYRKYADVNSFIHFMIMNEVSKNVDGYRLSTYFYKKKDNDGGKLHMGPVWDFNLGFGNADYCTSGSPQGFVLEFNAICSGDPWLIPFWWSRLLQDAKYRSDLGLRWTGLRQGPFATEKIHAYIDSVANILDQESQQRNFQAWPVLGTYVWPNYFIGQTFDQEVAYLKDWIGRRMAWLDNQWGNFYSPVDETGVISFSLSPNPVSEKLQITYTSKLGGIVDLQLIDVSGRQVGYVRWVIDESEPYVREVDVAYLPNGVYIANIKTPDGKTVTRKLLKGILPD